MVPTGGLAAQGGDWSKFPIIRGPIFRETTRYFISIAVVCVDDYFWLLPRCMHLPMVALLPAMLQVLGGAYFFGHSDGYMSGYMRTLEIRDQTEALVVT